MIEALELIGSLTLHLALTAAPGVAAAMLALRLGARSVPLILAVALVVSGLVGILGFWSYYADPSLGKAWTFVSLAGSIAIGFASWAAIRRERAPFSELRAALLLWGLASLFVVFLGFLHGGSDEPVSMAASRFSHQLPSDNDVPRFFAVWFVDNGHQGEPPALGGEWLSSDRPPLQTGYSLSQWALAYSPDGIGYQVQSVALQQLWVVAVWALLCAAGLRRRARGLAMIAVLAGDVAIVHGFFVWPKLLAATFFLAAVALAVAPEWSRWRRDPAIGALVGALFALAMLAHGGTAFGFVPLLALIAWRGLPSFSWAVVAALAVFALSAPWAAYQQWGDPPGDRLLKWQLAGVTAIDERGVPEAIVDSYREVGLGGAIEAKWASVTQIAGTGEAGYRVDRIGAALGNGALEDAIAELRAARFFSLAWLVGLFLVALPAMLLARNRARGRSAEWRFALLSFAFVGIGCVAWCLLLFGAPNAVAMIHVGSLALPLLAICGSVAGLYAVSPRLATVLVGANVALALLLYVPAFTPVQDSSYSPFAAALTAAALAGFAWLALRTPSSAAAVRERPSASLDSVAGDLEAEAGR